MFLLVPSGWGCALVHCFLRSAIMKMVVWVVDRCSLMLPLVRNGHVSGDLVVCIGRLRATCIELSSRTSLQYLSFWSLYHWGGIGILCCVPKSMEFMMPCLYSPSCTFFGRVMDLSCAQCPECAERIVLAASVHWCLTVLLDAECSVSEGSWP